MLLLFAPLSRGRIGANYFAWRLAGAFLPVLAGALFIVVVGVSAQPTENFQWLLQPLKQAEAYVSGDGTLNPLVIVFPAAYLAGLATAIGGAVEAMRVELTGPPLRPSRAILIGLVFAPVIAVAFVAPLSGAEIISTSDTLWFTLHWVATFALGAILTSDSIVCFRMARRAEP